MPAQAPHALKRADPEHRLTDIPDPRRAARLLLIEVGNSHVTLATADGPNISELQRIEDGDIGQTVNLIVDAWNEFPGDRSRAMVIASVVPEMTDALIDRLEDRIDDEPLVIGRRIPVPIESDVIDRDTVGVDRLCGAAAAFAEIEGACVVASFGTATTIDCVDSSGVFRGGAILPGMGTQSWALHERTAQLPTVEIRVPDNVYGRDTREAIVNGIVYGSIGALREIVERYATDLHAWPQLVVTGGMASVIKDRCEFIDAVVPNLVLRGMVHAYRQYFATE
jgi:type III pantothenate kinase